MTAALQPLITLLEQTERERDEIATKAQRADLACTAARTQASALTSYRSEYEQRWSTQFQREGGMELVHCYHGFMERLTQAVDQQQRAVAQAEFHAERVAGELRQAKLRVASVRKLIERRVREVQQSDDRREQKQTDEFASRSAWTQRNAEAARSTVY